MQKRRIRTAILLLRKSGIGDREKGAQCCQLVDEILAIFPQEADFYRRCGEIVVVGHPCSDRVRLSEKIEKKNSFRLFPGSRQQEIERLLPLFRRNSHDFKTS